MDSGLPLLYRLPVDGNDRLTSVFDERVVYLNLSCRGTLYLQKESPPVYVHSRVAASMVVAKRFVAVCARL